MAPITIINLFITFLLTHAPHEAQGAPNQKFACTQEFKATLTSDLTEYLKSPTETQTKSLSVRLCHASPEGESPCPFNISQDRVADFEAASQKSPGIVPVIACAAQIAEGATAEELLELLAKLLDKHKDKFFSAWQLLPKEVRKISPGFQDFAMLAPDTVDDHPKRIKIFESRIEVLQRAPAKLKADVAGALKAMKEEVEESKQIMAAESEEADVYFKTSKFHGLLADKVLRLTTKDQQRVTTLAGQALDSEGLNYKVYPKGESRNWSICSTSNFSAGSCKTSTVSFQEGEDNCGKFGKFAALAQLNNEWVLSTRSTNFRVDAQAYFNPVAVKLLKSDILIRSWNLPEGFTPNYLSQDLKTLYVKSVVVSPVGRALAVVNLMIKDNGHMQFIEFSDDISKLKQLAQQEFQNLKGPDDSTYTVRLPSACR